MRRSRILVAALALLVSAPLAAEEVRLQQGDLTLVAKRVGGTASGPVFLILHGTWAHYGMEIIQALQAGLAERGYSSLAPNLSLGLDARTGFRSCDGNYPMRHDAAVQELAAWVELLEGEGVQELVLVGHSRGGAQVALYLQAPASIVRGAVLLAPMVFDAAAVLEQFTRDNGADVAARLQSAADMGLVGPVDFLNCADARVPAGTLRSYYGPEPVKHTPALLAGIEVPVQVFLGTADEVARWSSAEIEHAESRPNVRVHEIEDAGHFFRDLFTEDVLDLVTADMAVEMDQP